MRLIIKKEGDSVKEFQIAKQTFRIGRGSDCDVVLSDRLVSRKHAVLSYDEMVACLKLKVIFMQ